MKKTIKVKTDFVYDILQFISAFKDGSFLEDSL